ncbi:hypothetical protein HELRODRAFT_178939 [Helobdella robusta]|uniref:Uncharacterized protein n=1 Tax=Helobdella robusta TaxID=6412 RepID=T1FDX6_HELRO|nr:hypothetical protein HELRODRAFT_178939 [Helobdella robusta]ESN95759.1 hypothetical protein HELRODRAFT_178939 [Helobdella robusta]
MNNFITRQQQMLHKNHNFINITNSFIANKTLSFIQQSRMGVSSKTSLKAKKHTRQVGEMSKAFALASAVIGIQFKDVPGKNFRRELKSYLFSKVSNNTTKQSSEECQ